MLFICLPLALVVAVPAIRLWISFSNPFITASTVRSTETPTATPATEKAVSRVMKAL